MTTELSYPTRKVIGALVLCGLMVAGGLVHFCFVAAPRLLEWSRLGSYSVTKGIVVDVSLREEVLSRRNGIALRWIPDAEAIFTANDQRYRCSRPFLFETMYDSKDDAIEALARNGVQFGEACTAYYKPRNPAVALLSKSVDGWSVFVASRGLFVVAVGGVGAVAVWFLGKREIRLYGGG